MHDGQDDRPAAVPPRRRGRPRVSGEETVSVNTRLPVSAYDRLLQVAKTRRTSIAEAVRDVIRRRLS